MSQKVKTSSIIIYVLYICFSIVFFVDCITGYFLLNNIHISISIPFKFFILFLAIIAIGQADCTALLFPLGLILLSLISIISSLGTIGGKSPLTISNIFKLIYCPIIYVFCNLYYKHGKRYNQVANIGNAYLFFFFINIFIGLLGFGFNTYGNINGFGIKGFYYEGNSLSGVLLCLFIYTYFLYGRKIGISILFLLTSFLIGTKTCILGGLLFFLLSSFFHAKFRYKVLILAIASILVYVIIIYYSQIPILKFQINGILHRFDKYDNILHALSSGRTTRFAFVKQVISNTETVHNNLFGYGYITNFEMDFFDVLVAYGILMWLCIVSFYFNLIWKSRHNTDLLIFNLIYFSISFVAGHIWFSTTNTILFCLLNTVEIHTIKKHKKLLYITYSKFHKDY